MHACTNVGVAVSVVALGVKLECHGDRRKTGVVMVAITLNRPFSDRDFVVEKHLVNFLRLVLAAVRRRVLDAYVLI